jgi:hypothetical protein
MRSQAVLENDSNGVLKGRKNNGVAVYSQADYFEGDGSQN